MSVWEVTNDVEPAIEAVLERPVRNVRTRNKRRWSYVKIKKSEHLRCQTDGDRRCR